MVKCRIQFKLWQKTLLLNMKYRSLDTCGNEEGLKCSISREVWISIVRKVNVKWIMGRLNEAFLKLIIMWHCLLSKLLGTMSLFIFTDFTFLFSKKLLLYMNWSRYNQISISLHSVNLYLTCFQVIILQFNLGFYFIYLSPGSKLTIYSMKPCTIRLNHLLD